MHNLSTIFPILLTLLVSSHQAEQGFRCGGPRDMIEFGPPNHRNLLTRSSSLSPIRLSYQYLNFDLGSPERNQYFKDTLMPAVDTFFTTRLSVYSVTQAIVLSISSCLGFSIPTEHKTTGVSDADIIVYIKSEKTAGQYYIAYAGSCSIDTGSRFNVVAGLVMVNIPNFIGSSFESHFSTMTHEIYHLLGFSSNLYQYWRKPDGSAHAAVTEKITVRGASKTIIKTPNVVAKAREAFECETLLGVELEDQGGSGTAGSHWDMRIMHSDFMIGKDHNDPIYTAISLALMQDTGWYEVDYTNADLPLYAKGYGCKFIDEKCIVNGVTGFPGLYCDTANDWACDTWAFRKAKCGITTYGSISPAFQYFTTSTKGGDQYADFCPLLQGYSNGNCRAAKSSDTIQQSGTDEVIGPKSRCFVSTLSRTSTLSSYSACYEVLSCSDLGAVVKVGSSTITCPFEGNVQSVPGYRGKIICPASKVLCEGFPCKDGCAGAGKCVNGVCVCNSGFYGDNCLLKCEVGCESCNASSCSKCQSDQAELVEGSCTCKAGYAPDSKGNCLSNSGDCGPLCISCQAGVCSSCVASATLSNKSCTCPTSFYQSSNSCLPCSAGCQSCTSTICQKCQDVNSQPSSTECVCKASYVKSAQGICELVKSCDSLCTTCTNGVCSKCTFGADLTGNSCNCKTGFRKSDLSCVACPSACGVCDESKCLKCGVNSSFSGTDCVCNAGFAVSEGVCVACPGNCKSCSNVNICLHCQTGFYVDSGLCKNCVTGCEVCDSFTCSKCRVGYYLKMNVCVSGCADFCFKCSTAGACVACQERYFLMSSSLCSACVANCKVCLEASKCTECLDGFETTSAGTCQKNCGMNCGECDYQSYKCLSCLSGFFLEDGKCVKCGSYCEKCKSQSECTQCKTGYQLGYGSCKSGCPANCNKCVSKTLCSTCVSGYSLNIFGTCSLMCPENCLKCDFKGKCVYCSTGYYKSSGSCKACNEICTSCISDTICTGCVSGYYLSINWKCEACPSNCAKCLINICIICNSGYILKNGKCK